MNWILIAVIALTITAGVAIFAMRKISGGKYVGVALGSFHSGNEMDILKKWTQANLAGTEYWTKRHQESMWRQWMYESSALWSRGITGGNYSQWRQEKIEAGCFKYDDEPQEEEPG